MSHPEHRPKNCPVEGCSACKAAEYKKDLFKDFFKKKTPKERADEAAIQIDRTVNLNKELKKLGLQKNFK